MPFFLFKILALWIFTSTISPLFAETAEKIKDPKRKVDANRFVSNIHQIWKDLVLLDSPSVHPEFEKKIKERRQISIINDVFCYSLNTDNLGCILTLQVRQKAKKAPDA